MLFTIIFIWLGIAQLGLLTQGLERVDWPARQEGKAEEIQPDIVEEEDENDLPPDEEEVDEEE